MEVRERLRDLIKSRMGNNQSELARRIGEHPNWVNYRLTGTTAIKADELPRLAAGLGISPCDFFEDHAPLPAPTPIETYTPTRVDRMTAAWAERLVTLPDAEREVELLRALLEMKEQQLQRDVSTGHDAT